MIRSLVLLISILFIINELGAQSFPYSSGGQLMPEQAAYDVTFYELHLEVIPEDQEIEGMLTLCAYAVHPMDWLVLNLDTALIVSEVFLFLDYPDLSGRNQVEYRRDLGNIWIDLERTFQPGELIIAAILFEGKPKSVPKGGFSGFIWEKTEDGSPWISTSCEGAGADIWWPCKDHPSDRPDSMALHIIVPSPFKAISNGRLISVDRFRGPYTQWNWFVSTPISNYGVSLNIAPYIEIVEDYKSVNGNTYPVTFWALPKNEEKAKAIMPEFLDHMFHLETIAGPYPFWSDKYGIAEVPYLGMEHQTIIAYGANYQDDVMAGIDWDFDALHQHELSHEWYGNMVAPYDWGDIWLNEGPAQYAQILYAEYALSEQKVQELLKIYRTIISNHQPLVSPKGSTFRQSYNNDIYFKGALVLHSLRYLLGEELFFEFLHRWTYPDPESEKDTVRNQSRFASTTDFIQLAEKTYGKNLDWFFDVYLFSAPLPELVMESRDDMIKLFWRTPDNLPFPMPVDVQIGKDIKRLQMKDGVEAMTIPEGTEVIIDPKQWVLKK